VTDGRAVAVLLEQCLAPVPGGTGRYARELARALAQTAPEGATVTGWTAWHRDVSAARVAGVVGPRRLPLPPRALVAAWERGAGVGMPSGDLVHSPTLLFPPRPRGPLVVTIHDAVPWTHPETLSRRGVAWHRRTARRAARVADAIVVPTRAVSDELARWLPLDRVRLAVVGEGVSPDLAVPPDADLRAARLGLPPGGYAVSLATLEPRKGLDVAIRALARTEAPDLPLLVAGQPGWGAVDLEAEAERAGLPPMRVRAMGRLDDADLAVLLSRASVLVQPSRSEGFGLPVLEAMALGVPVVTSDAPALVEVGGGATRVVPVGDPEALAAALAEVVSDQQLRERMVALGRRRSAEFSWERTGLAMWALYADLAG
jgi:glycosyltransferase involved in cell wall biosynthesis